MFCAFLLSSNFSQKLCFQFLRTQEPTLPIFPKTQLGPQQCAISAYSGCTVYGEGLGPCIILNNAVAFYAIIERVLSNPMYYPIIQQSKINNT